MSTAELPWRGKGLSGVRSCSSRWWSRERAWLLPLLSTRILPRLGRQFWPYALVSAGVTLLHWPVLRNHFLSFDEPAYLVQAARLRSLDAFMHAFVYRIETKTQLGLIPYILARSMSPDESALLVQVFGLLATLLSTFLLIAFSRRFLGSALPGTVASFAWALCLAIGPGPGFPQVVARSDLLTPLLEYFQTPFTLASLYLFLWGSGADGQRPRYVGWIVFGAGMAWAIAMLVKPSVLLLAPLYAAAFPLLGERFRLKDGWLAARSFALGAGVPVVAVFAPYLFSSQTLAELRFNLLDVNLAYAGASAEPPLNRALTLFYWLRPQLVYTLFPFLPLVALLVRRRRGTDGTCQWE